MNNAGYGTVGPFEASTPEQVERQVATNVTGLMNVTREVLPHFREWRRGVIINVSSVGGRVTFPFYSVYHATKWAVEGFSEALVYELEPFHIRVKIIEQGPIKTDFYYRSLDVMTRPGLTAYDELLARAMPTMQKVGADAPGPGGRRQDDLQGSYRRIAPTSIPGELRGSPGPPPPASQPTVHGDREEDGPEVTRPGPRPAVRGSRAEERSRQAYTHPSPDRAGRADCGLPHSNTTVRLPSTRTRSSRCQRTAWASTRRSTSRPMRTMSSTLSLWEIWATSWLMIGPASSSAVT